ncbi:hypothetical protein [Streptomyces sp. NPDC088707]|uniref:hypothetical protein n=1 Tax=Streptomyces sp. NPDC088707 TaxID=3365871 RepID=UPI0037FB5156
MVSTTVEHRRRTTDPPSPTTTSGRPANPQSHPTRPTPATEATIAAIATLAAHTPTDATTAGDRETGTVKVEASAGDKKAEVIKA